MRIDYAEANTNNYPPEYHKSTIEPSSAIRAVRHETEYLYLWFISQALRSARHGCALFQRIIRPGACPVFFNDTVLDHAT